MSSILHCTTLLSDRTAGFIGIGIKTLWPQVKVNGKVLKIVLYEVLYIYNTSKNTS
jgi:hypothetical protein